MCWGAFYSRGFHLTEITDNAHTRTAHRRTQKELQIQTQIWYDVAAAAFIF